MEVNVGEGRFTLELFEQLQEAYRENPLKKVPVARDHRSFQEKAHRRLDVIAKQLKADFRDKVVLELGCGHGWLTAYLPEFGGAKEAIGVDVRRYDTWDQHRDPRVRLLDVDLASEQAIPPESVDFVISGAVFEHVTRPVEMLAAVFDALRLGGTAWLYFNLYRGPQASHRYNEVYFPWPHLLFDDAVCRAYYEKHESQPKVTFSWVNRMTLATYVQTCHELGFRIVSLTRRVTPIDVPFYLRFEEVLGRYPALDLETDFATLVLEKPRPAAALRPRPHRTIPQLGYLDAQRALEQALQIERATQSV
jgi:SAM-dependent methyltransferase